MDLNVKRETELVRLKDIKCGEIFESTDPTWNGYFMKLKVIEKSPIYIDDEVFASRLSDGILIAFDKDEEMIPCRGVCTVEYFKEYDSNNMNWS